MTLLRIAFPIVFLSGDNSTDVDYKTDTLTQNDDYSILCDELLEEFVADVIYGNVSQNRVKSNIEMCTRNITKSNDKNHACVNHKYVIHVNKVKTVELENIAYGKDISDNSGNSHYKANYQHENTHEDYFNNLLAIIEEAAQSLQSL